MAERHNRMVRIGFLIYAFFGFAVLAKCWKSVSGFGSPASQHVWWSQSFGSRRCMASSLSRVRGKLRRCCVGGLSRSRLSGLRYWVLAYLIQVSAGHSAFVLPCERVGEAAHPGPAFDVCVGLESVWSQKQGSSLAGSSPWRVALVRDAVVCSNSGLMQEGIVSTRPSVWKNVSRFVRSCSFSAKSKQLGRKLDRGHDSVRLAVSPLASRLASRALCQWPAPNDPACVGTPSSHYCKRVWISLRSHVSSGSPAQEELLKPLTAELVLGKKGPRVICGDFNHSVDALLQTQLWMSCGWVEAQLFSRDHWHTEVQPTCKGRTVRDFVWLSPEAAAMCVGVSVVDTFAEHSTVFARLRVPDSSLTCLYWPLPGEIPWDQVDLDSLHSAQHQAVALQADSSAWFADWSRAFERGLDGHVRSPGGGLQGCCFGRGRRLAPSAKQATVIAVKQARPGEEVCSSHLLSREVNRWYRQLRRLQSLVHAVRAAKQSPAAVEYRLQLWSSILRAPGFCVDFATWWCTRPIKLQGSPSVIAPGLSFTESAELVFLDFRENYRSFEKWCLERRRQVLQLRYADTYRGLMQASGRPRPEQVDTLTLEHTYSILAVDSDSQQIHLDAPLDLRGSSTWVINGAPISLLS